MLMERMFAAALGTVFLFLVVAYFLSSLAGGVVCGAGSLGPRCIKLRSAATISLFRIALGLIHVQVAHVGGILVS